eukprot:scaffold10297_cov113-Isochrysis_galbana.AAC.9
MLGWCGVLGRMMPRGGPARGTCCALESRACTADWVENLALPLCTRDGSCAPLLRATVTDRSMATVNPRMRPYNPLRFVALGVNGDPAPQAYSRQPIKSRLSISASRTAASTTRATRSSSSSSPDAPIAARPHRRGSVCPSSSPHSKSRCRLHVVRGQNGIPLKRPPAGPRRPASSAPPCAPAGRSPPTAIIPVSPLAECSIGCRQYRDMAQPKSHKNSTAPHATETTVMKTAPCAQASPASLAHAPAPTPSAAPANGIGSTRALRALTAANQRALAFGCLSSVSKLV